MVLLGLLDPDPIPAQNADSAGLTRFPTRFPIRAARFAWGHPGTEKVGRTI